MALPAILGAIRGAAGVAGLAGSGGIGAAGRSIGAAVSGSGTIGEKLSAAGTAISTALAPAEKAMNSFAQTTFNMQIAAQGLGALGKAIIGLPALPIKALAGAIGLLQSPVVAVVDALKGMVGAVGAVGAAVSDFVKLSNPVYVQKFNMAMEDLMAVIGKALTPLLESSTVFVRGFADAISLIADPLAELLKSGLGPLQEIFKTLVQTFAPLLGMFNTFVKLIGAIATPLSKFTEIAVKMLALPFELFFHSLNIAMELLIAPLTVLARLFGDLMEAIGKFVDQGIGWIRKLFGISAVTDRSVGAAVRPAQIGSVEEYGKRAQQAAFSLGTAAGPEVKTADYAEKIYNYLTKGLLIDLQKFGVDFATNILAGISALVPKVPSVGEVARRGVDAGRRLEATEASLPRPSEVASGLFHAATFGAFK